MNQRNAHPVRAQLLPTVRGSLSLLSQLSAGDQALLPADALRVSLDDFERAFGDTEVQVAVAAGLDLRFLYVNPGYRAIRPDVPMVGRTYRDVFPEAAEAGAEGRLQEVIRSSRRWILDDYPTPLPDRPLPAWWEGECAPIDLAGGGRPDAVLIMIWEVTHRHLPTRTGARKSDGQLRVEAARAKLLARMRSAGLRPEDGWRISEEVHEGLDDTVWVLRPLHMQRVAPVELVERVAFGAEAGG